MDTEIITGEVLRQLVSSKERMDKRKVSESRPNKLIPSSSSSAQMVMIANSNGSTMLAHGNTLITCAVTCELSPVQPTQPDRGFISVDIVYNAATCYATSRCDAATLQPALDDRDASLWTGEASSILQKAIEASNIIDLKSLLISESEACFVLKICCVVMQDDGGVLEACCAAAMNSLENFEFPTEFVLPDGSRQEWETSSETKKILVASSPSVLRISTVGFLFVKQTEVKGENNGVGASTKQRVAANSAAEANEVVIVVDPSSPEAVVCDGCVSVAVLGSKLVSFTCHGGKPATMQVLEAITKFVLTH